MEAKQTKANEKGKDPVWLLIISAVIFALLVRFWNVGAETVSYVAEGVREAEQNALAETDETPTDMTSSGGPLQDSRYLYDDEDEGNVITMYLTVRTGNASEGTNHTWEEVNAHPAYYYTERGIDRYRVEGLLQVGDENGPAEGAFGYDETVPNVTVQIRGESSSRNVQKSYKISIKPNHGEWNGMTTIALNKHVSDYLRFRNKLAFDLLKGIEELPSLRTRFVHLYVKDETAGPDAEFVDYGLYTQVEVWNKKALRAHGFDRDGYLYKVINSEFYRDEDVIRLSDDPAYDRDAFEQRFEIKGEEDHAKLIAMLEDVNNEEIPIEEVLQRHFDITNLAYWMGSQILMGNVDTRNHNFYLYSPLSADTWYILPWDLDGSFGGDDPDVIEWAFSTDMWNRGVCNYWSNVLFRRCLQSEQFRTALDAAVEDIMSYLTAERVGALTRQYSAVVKGFVYDPESPDSEHHHLTSADYDRVTARLPEVISFFYERYKESYDYPMPFFIGTPVAENGRLRVRWDESFDFQGGTLTYTATIAKDPEMKDVVASYEGTALTLETDMLPEGQYFIRVWVKDEDGHEQSAFDHYLMRDPEDIRFSGVRVFYVNADGTVSVE